jgi:hypothetical protein
MYSEHLEELLSRKETRDSMQERNEQRTVQLTIYDFLTEESTNYEQSNPL